MRNPTALLPLRGGRSSGWIGGWRRLPKRLGAVTVGYKCQGSRSLPSPPSCPPSPYNLPLGVPGLGVLGSNGTCSGSGTCTGDTPLLRREPRAPGQLSAPGT